MLLAAATTRAGNDLLIVGLSTENVRRLQAGLSINTNIKTHGRHLSLVIFTGETEDVMQSELSSLIGPDTVVDRREVS